MLLTVLVISPEGGNTRVELKLNVCIVAFEVFRDGIVTSQDLSRRVFNVVGILFRPVVCVFDDELVQGEELICWDFRF